MAVPAFGFARAHAAPCLSALSICLSGCSLMVSTDELFGQATDAQAVRDVAPDARELAPPTGVSASMDDPDAVELSWAPPAVVPPDGYQIEIERDGVPLVTLSSTQTRYRDTAAQPGSVGSITASASHAEYMDKVVVTWNTPTSTPGQTHSYRVSTAFGGAKAGALVTGQRGRFEVAEFRVTRGSLAAESVGTALTYEDRAAPRASVSLRASSRISYARSAILLSAAAQVTLRTQEYRVVAVGKNGLEVTAAPVTGALGRLDASWLDIVWERRSTANVDPFVPLPDVTGESWYDDTAAPSVAYEYRATVSSTWADGATSTTTTTRLPLSEVAVGYDHACGLLTDRSIRCWGAKNPTTANAPGGGGYLSLVAGTDPTRDYACALDSSGAPRCWGTLVDRGGLEASTSTGFLALAGGLSHACALSTQAGVRCWGSDIAGQVTGPSGASGTHLSAGDASTCLLTPTGTVQCWGAMARPGNDLPTVPATALALGANHGCILDGASSLACFGSDSSGQAPRARSGPFRTVHAGGQSTCVTDANNRLSCIGAMISAPTMEAPLDLPVARVSIGPKFGCALTGDGRPHCFGASDSWSLTLPPKGTFRSVSAGGAHTCGVRQDGSLTCWGANTSGEAPATRSGPYQAVSTGYAHTCALRVDGTLDCFGADASEQVRGAPAAAGVTAVASGGNGSCAIAGGKITCWGRHAIYQLDGSYSNVCVGYQHVCGVRDDGKVVCDGNLSGVAEAEAGVRFQSVACGDDFACMLGSDSRIVCAGDNAFNQAPTTPSPALYTGVLAGSVFACGITQGGRISCWGRHPTASDVTDILRTPVLAAHASGDYLCGIRPDGHVLCAGASMYGQAPSLLEGP